MSLNLMPSNDLMARGFVSHGIVVQVAAFVQSTPTPVIPLDPPDIVSKNDEGFSIDMNNMEQERPYMMTFADSKYVIWKDKNDALVIKEV